jgi:hypothetical protein
VAFESEKESDCALAFPDEPSVDAAQLAEQLDGQSCHLIAPADKARFQRKQAGLSVSRIPFVEGPQLVGVPDEEGVEEEDGLVVVVEPLHDDVRQVLVLVGEQAQDLLHAHPQRRLQQQHQELEGSLAVLWVLGQVQPPYIDLLLRLALHGLPDADTGFIILLRPVLVPLVHLPNHLDD